MIALDIDVSAVEREDLPLLAGRLAELQAKVTLRLLDVQAMPQTSASRILTLKEAAVVAGVSARWLSVRTRGLPFRCDLSRKNIRFVEVGLLQWLGRRKR